MAEQRPRFYTHVYRLVAQVPRGKVVTYGQVAALLGAPRAARAVGTALRYLPRELSQQVPWQRVINSSGGISIRGDVIRVEEHTRYIIRTKGASGGQSVRTLVAPLPGRIVKVAVKPGDRVEKGATLLVIEAMKMENEFKAGVSGTIAEVRVEPGQAVNGGDVLIVIR